jgi:adenylosuccinate synthase
MAKKRKMTRGTAQKGGNPPKHTQFRKGTSGNPRGRPKGSKNLSTYLMEAARDQATATVGGRTRRISNLQATTMQLATKAAGGDKAAIGRFLDWVDEMETRAANVKPSEFPIGEPDIEVIRSVYERMKQCDPEKKREE